MNNMIIEDLEQFATRQDVEEQILRTPLQCETDVLQDFQAYYNAVCVRVGGIPSRRDIKPQAIPRILEHVYLLELRGAPEAGAESYFYRVMGTKLARMIGQDLSQKSLASYGHPNRRARSAMTYDYVIRTKKPARIVGRIKDAGGKPLLIESITYPLSNDGVHVNMVIGALGFLGQ